VMTRNDARMEALRALLNGLDATVVRSVDDVNSALVEAGAHELVKGGTKGYYWDVHKKKWKIKVGVRERARVRGAHGRIRSGKRWR